MPCPAVFPDAYGAFTFFLYTLLGTNHGILVALSRKESGSFSYNPTTVVLVVECVKLVAATAFYAKSSSLGELVQEVVTHRKLGALYFVPALLYCLFNNLSFINLANYDPTTYFVLLQLRVVMMGFVYQCLFRKRLTMIQWLSLVLLTIGCIIKEIGYQKWVKKDISLHNGKDNEDKDDNDALHPLLTPNIAAAFLFMVVQGLCSCFASVYNEYLLKGHASAANQSAPPLMVQNVFMYLNSILFNILFLVFKGDFVSVFQWESIQSIGHPIVIGIIVNSATTGLVTSVFLKSLNSILKSFANAIEILLTTFVSYILFNSPLDLFTALAVLVVICASFVYNLNPVKNEDLRRESEQREGEEN